MEFATQPILIVDDNDDDAFLMESLFGKLGITNPIRRVADGEEALAYFSGTGRYGNRGKFPFPALVLLDLNMPRRNGFEVLKWLKEQPGFRCIVVYILSASMRQVDVDQALSLGANGYIVKPSQVEELIELLRAWHYVARHSRFASARMECGQEA